MMQSDSNLGGGASGGESGGLGSSGLSGAGTGGSTGGLGGSAGGGLGGSTGSGGLSGTGTGGSTGDLGGSTGGLGGSTGGLSGADTGGSTGGLGGSTGGTGTGYGTEGGGFTTGDDFDTFEGTYRRHYTATPVTTTPPVTTYEEARPAYEAGHRAAVNPTYANRPYEEVEVDLEREYPQKERFAAVKGYARHAFEWKTIVGALALAGGAWWVSRKLSETVSEMSEEEERDCRTFYESHPARATVPYEQARTVYVVGYAASRNPDYTGRAYDDVEPSLRSGWSGSRAGSYDSLRDFTRRGYERGSSRSSGLNAGTSGSASFGGGTGGSTGGTTGGSTGGTL